MSLNDEIQPISDEALQGLIDALANLSVEATDCADAAEKLTQSVKKSYMLMAENVALSCVYSLFIYENKLEKATFITRWYWKKKITKTEKRLEELEKYLEELKKIKL